MVYELHPQRLSVVYNKFDVTARGTKCGVLWTQYTGSDVVARALAAGVVAGGTRVATGSVVSAGVLAATALLFPRRRHTYQLRMHDGRGMIARPTNRNTYEVSSSDNNAVGLLRYNHATESWILGDHKTRLPVSATTDVWRGPGFTIRVLSAKKTNMLNIADRRFVPLDFLHNDSYRISPAKPNGEVPLLAVLVAYVARSHLAVSMAALVPGAMLVAYIAYQKMIEAKWFEKPQLQARTRELLQRMREFQWTRKADRVVIRWHLPDGDDLSVKEVDRAYKKLSQQLHPDKNVSEEKKNARKHFQRQTNLRSKYREAKLAANTHTHTHTDTEMI